MTNIQGLYIGIMSGTSLDGVDTALVSIDGQQIRLIVNDVLPYPPALKQQVLAICQGQSTSISSIGELDHQLGHLYAEAVEQLLAKSNKSAADILAIGNHGQTVFHQPDGPYPFTTQLGDNHILAVRSGISVIGDFRRKDMALGGQGAPLVPAFHRYLFAKQTATQVILNIGGIANVSILQPNGEVIGFDTGPGNVLIDLWCSHKFNLAYDQDAALAYQGKIDQMLLNHLSQDPYLARPAPKSTGREHYHFQWLEEQLQSCSSLVSDYDILRTLTEFTARCVAKAIKPYQSGSPCQLLVCGGGANNPLIMQALQNHLPDWEVATTDHQAISGDYMEAMAFAWLAHCHLNHIPSNLPSVTGAKKSVPLGVCYSPD
ncbi:anhydro-N-acetylmuramic acid kinase [Vibrio hippocampi]|uniref:Anhydro-N-acetylmuramic acid kinase n=1 Tax=Vibrio hippocampi TaxID=654686 RepID=A0ABN8DL69_9VIBR|nr:anhydro-N-acetylmuramic acid kinase [Vibrio hippocampi]CAH0527043.1 Anhydro-N-acetylmuramic acid kinase [Vibrio hippocampi]